MNGISFPSFLMIIKAHVRPSIMCAIFGVVIGLIAFIVNYNFIDFTFPGYQIFTAPARFTLSFFSEETAFWPKMAIFLVGQFVGYFILGNILNRIFFAVKSKPKQ